MSTQLLRGAWFDEANPDEAARRLYACVQDLRTRDRRADTYEKHYQLYGGTRLIGLRPWEEPAASALLDSLSPVSDKLRLNVVKAAVDTITSKVGKLRPRPTFLTNGGDWSLQLKAKKLQRFMDGAYHQSDVHELGPDVFRDAMLFGTGVLYPYRRGKRLCAERVPLWELWVDPLDALYGTPRVLHRTKWVSRDALVAEHGLEYADAPLDPQTLTGGVAGDEDATRAGMVLCVESLVLPCEVDDGEPQEPRAEDAPRDAARYGRHTVTVGNRCICDEDYACSQFPFVFFHWTKPVQGFWGQSAVAEVVGLQVEINKLLQLVQTSMQRVGQPVVLTKPDVILSPNEVTNEVALHIQVKDDSATSLDDAIKVVTFQPVNPAITQHIWNLYGKAFEILGSNQLAASATAPAGLESGDALDTLAEEHSERFMTVSRHFEHCMGEQAARRFIRLAKEIDSEYGKFALRAPGSKASVVIKWRDVALDEDAYLIQVFPTSVLPTTPSLRIKEIERLAAAGWIDPTEARRLLDFPDLRANTDLATADTDNLLRQLEVMLEEGKPQVPEPYQDLEKAKRWATASVLRAKADGVYENHVQLVRNFVTMCESLQIRAMPAQAAAQPAPQGAPAPAGAFGAAPQQPQASAGGDPALAAAA